MELPLVRINDYKTMMVCARFAILTRSLWLLNIFRLVPATNASRKLFCWYKNHGFVPGSTFVQIPHSSTTRATFFSGSYLSIIVEWRVTSSSIRRHCFIVPKYSFSSNMVADPLSAQVLGTV